ncbi:transposase [Mycobacterium paragordonae]|nr:transposase [Mycobacterium paragordonae]TDK99448.1 transposase [Mycobacterium paragordonae]
MSLPYNGIGALPATVLPPTPGPDPEIRRLIVADTITEIHQRSRNTYGGRRIRSALLADYDMNVNLKLVRSIMAEHGLHGLPHPPRRIPNLIRVPTPTDLVNRHFTATPLSANLG